MNKQHITDTVFKLVAAQTGIPNIRLKRSDTMSGLKLVSYDLKQLTMRLEELFGIELEETDIKPESTVYQIRDLVQAKSTPVVEAHDDSEMPKPPEGEEPAEAISVAGASESVPTEVDPPTVDENGEEVENPDAPDPIPPEDYTPHQEGFATITEGDTAGSAILKDGDGNDIQVSGQG